MCLELTTNRGLKPRGWETRLLLANKGTAFACLFLLLFCHAASATVRLPLDGFVRPARFFPVMVDGADTATSLTFSAEGCLPTQLEPTGQTSRIVPILAYGDPHELHWPGGTLPLRTIGNNERLIGAIASDLPADLFPDARLIPIHLDPADPLPGPPVVWETLDAIVLDSVAFARIDDAHRSALLAGGVTLAARGDRPDDRWPWQKHGSCWILRHKLAGPVDELIDDAVYAPTFAWQPGWPGRVRGQVFGVAVVLLVLILATLLVGRGSRASAITAMAICLLFAGGIIAWRHWLGSSDLAGGDISVFADRLMQRDSWVYQRAKGSDSITVPWAGSTRPIFASALGLTNCKMKLVVPSDDQTRFEYTSSPGHCLAFMRRQVVPADIPAISSGRDSPMQDLARSIYLSPGFKITGESPADPGRWPGVVVQMSKP